MKYEVNFLEYHFTFFPTSSFLVLSSEEKYNHHGQIHFVEDALGGPRVYKSSSIFLKMRELVGLKDGENCRTAGVAANPFFF